MHHLTMIVVLLVALIGVSCKAHENQEPKFEPNEIEHLNKDFLTAEFFPFLMETAFSMGERKSIEGEFNYNAKDLRMLQSSDLSELNAFLDTLLIRVPDNDEYDFLNGTSLSNGAFATSDFTFKNIFIEKIRDQQELSVIEDIADDKYIYSIQLTGLDLDTTFDFQLDTGILSLSTCGEVKANFKDCKITLEIAFKSEDFDQYFPSYAELETCNVNLFIEAIRFDGSPIYDMLNSFDFLSKGIIAGMLEGILCGLIRDAVTGSFTGVLRTSANFINPYVNIDLSENDDLIDSEVVNFQESSSDSLVSTAVDFSDTNSSVGGAISLIITLVDNFLSLDVSDPENPYGKERDLGINTILRSNVLNDERVFVWDNEILLLDNSTVLDTKIFLQSASLYGLDTFTIFRPLQAFSQTISGNFELPSLKIVLNVGIELSTGKDTNDDALLMKIPEKFTENISFTVELSEIFLNASAYTLIDLDKLENIHLGSFLNTSNLLPCSVASMKEFRLDELNAKIDLNTPILDRFIDPQIGELVTNIFDALKFMSDKVLELAVPKYISTTLKEDITSIANAAIANVTADECPIFNSNPNAYLDVRDLLMEGDQAGQAGAKGTEPYGDVSPFITKILDENIVNPDEDGLPVINTLIPSDFEFNLTQSFRFCLPQLNLSFGVLGVSIQNLDTFDYPFDILRPVGRNKIHNQFTIGGTERPLQLGMKFFSSTIGTTDVRDIDQYNEFDFSVEITKLEFILAVFVTLYEEKFMQFPIIDLVSADCWLSAFPILEGENEKALGIADLDVLYENITMNIECVDCSNQQELPSLMELVKSVHGDNLAVEKVIILAKQYIVSPAIQDSIDRLIIDAPKKCPHHNDFEGEISENGSALGSLLALASGLVANAVPDENQTKVPEVDSGPMCFVIPSSGDGIKVPFSKDSHEAVIFLAVLLAELSVATTSLATINVGGFIASDPLAIQNVIAADTESKLLDLSNLNNTFLNWLDGPIKQLNASISDMMEDPDHENGKDIGINVYARRFFDDGAFVLQPNFSLNDFALQMPLTVHSIRVGGLDSFKYFVLSEFLGPQTLQTEFLIESLDIEISMSIVSPDPQGFENITENMTVSFGFKDAQFDLGIFLGIEEEALRTFQLGSFFSTSKMIACLVQVLEEINITRFLLSVGAVDNLKIDGFVSQEVKTVLESVQLKLFESYGTQLLSALTVFSDGFLRHFANGELKKLLNDSRECLLFDDPGGSVPSESVSGGFNFTNGIGASGVPGVSGSSINDEFVDFRDLFLKPEAALAAGGKGTEPYGNIWSTLYGLMQTSLLDSNQNGLPKFNDVVIVPFTTSNSGTPGTVVLEDPFFDQSLQTPTGGSGSGKPLNITAIYNTTISGLDTINYPLVLLHPYRAHKLNNSAVVGLDDNPLVLSTHADLSVTDANGKWVTNSFKFSMSLSKVGVQALLKAKIKAKSFMQFPFEDILNIDCWIATLPARPIDEFGVAIAGEEVFAGVEEFNIILEKPSIEIECQECADDEMSLYAEIFTGISTAFFTEELLTSEYIQNFVDKAIFKASKRCPHSPNFQPGFEEPEFLPFERPSTGFSTTRTFSAIGITLGIIFLISFCSSYLVNRSTKRKHAVWLLHLSDAEIMNLYKENCMELAQKKKLNSITKSLSASNEIPIFVRFCTPIIVILNIGLFISGHINLTATFDAVLSLAGQSIRIDNLYTSSIVELFELVWRLDLYIPAIIILMIALLWPYLKQTVTIILWFTPPYLISVERRGATFRILDFLAKWSTMDIFSIIAAFVIFRVRVKSPSNFPENYFGFDLLTVPLWGIYANLLAQVLTQISSHWIIYYHDKVVKLNLRSLSEMGTLSDSSAELDARNHKKMKQSVKSKGGQNVDITNTKKYSLCTHSFYLGGSRRGHKAKIRHEVNILVAVVGLLTLLSILMGSSIKYLRVTNIGILSKLISLGNDGNEPIINHSLITVAQTMLEVGDNLGTITEKFGVIILFSLLFVTCIIVPALQCLCAICLWFVSLTQRARENLISAIQILKAWQYLEVYYLGIFMMMWQSGTISEGIASLVCEGFVDLFSSLVAFNVLDEQDARCIFINASLDLSSIFHFASPLLLWLLTRFVEDAVAQQAQDIVLRQMDQSNVDEYFDDDSLEKDFQEIISALQNLPIQFTDSYPWATSDRLVKSRSLVNLQIDTAVTLE